MLTSKLQRKRVREYFNTNEMKTLPLGQGSFHLTLQLSNKAGEKACCFNFSFYLCRE